MSTHKALVLEKFGTPLVLEDISNPTCYTWLSARCTALRDDTPATSSAVVWCFQGASKFIIAQILYGFDSSFRLALACSTAIVSNFNTQYQTTCQFRCYPF